MLSLLLFALNRKEFDKVTHTVTEATKIVTVTTDKSVEEKKEERQVKGELQIDNKSSQRYL